MTSRAMMVECAGEASVFHHLLHVGGTKFSVAEDVFMRRCSCGTTAIVASAATPALTDTTAGEASAGIEVSNYRRISIGSRVWLHGEGDHQPAQPALEYCLVHLEEGRERLNRDAPVCA